MSQSQTNVTSIKEHYPIGTEIILERMHDEYAVPSGTKGTVSHVDDIGTIHVHWENGSTLGLIEGVDSFSVVTAKKCKP